jgi:hypothetical protein
LWVGRCGLGIMVAFCHGRCDACNQREAVGRVSVCTDRYVVSSDVEALAVLEYYRKLSGCSCPSGPRSAACNHGRQSRQS